MRARTTAGPILEPAPGWKRLVQPLAGLGLLVLAGPGYPAPLFRLDASLENSNWFPVKREVMEEVVTDSAISQLSSDFDFLLVSPDHPRAKSAQILRLRATLIEPAEDIKAVARISHDGQTRQAEVVADIETTDHRTVVRSLARAGREVARKLAAKLEPAAHGRKAQPADEELIETQRLLNQAAQLKREGKYEQSHAALRLILSRPDLPQPIRESVEQELHFRLPVYQADDLMDTYKGLDTPDEARAHYQFIESILRKALKRNLQSPEKQRRINQRLDTLYRIREYRLQSMNAQARARLGRLKTALSEQLHMNGNLAEDDLLELAERMDLELKVEDFDASGQELNTVVRTPNGYRFRITAGLRTGVRIRDIDEQAD